MTTTTHRVRRLGVFAASLGLVAGFLLVASPAQAAVGVDLSASSTTITEGQDVTLSWTSTDTISLTAGGAWGGSKTPVAAGSESVTPGSAGTFTYTLMATDENGREATDSVTVTVEASVPDPITPAPVTFPDSCTVVVPSSPNVTYQVRGGDRAFAPIAAGTYTALELLTLGDSTFGRTSLDFRASADAGHVLAPAAPDSWAIDLSGCLSFGPEIVSTRVACGELTFTNTASSRAALVTIELDVDDPRINVDILEPGDFRTIRPDSERVLVLAGTSNDPEQARLIRVDANCQAPGGNAADQGDANHPTVAPAAGLTGR